MDEHKGSGARRFAAWSAATEIARTTPWVERPREAETPWGFAIAGLAGTGAALALRRRKRAPVGVVAPIAPAPAKKRLPVIDTSTCLGCHACVDACPFDVIEVEKFVAVVARPDDCCGVVLCEQACPNGSLRIAEADAETPRVVDERLESVDVPGLFLAGDLAGLPLIKNALRQGEAAIDHIAAGLPKKRSRAPDSGVLDVVIVGAGPAGLAASLRAKELGLTYATLEQATVAASIRAFPRHKLVYDQPLKLPCEGELWMHARDSQGCTKEELLAQWERVVRKHALAIREGHRVVDLSRQDDGTDFVVRALHEGEERVFRARRVVVAIGRRGSPRKLPIAIPPSAEAKVFYHLADARSLAGQRVVIVGLGDTAMEAACALAAQPGTHVTLVHRGDGFTRGKTRNVAEVKALVDRKKIDLRLSTELVTLGDSVALETRGERSKVPADAVFVLIGGVASWDLLRSFPDLARKRLS
jgi:thioredoxin reductase